MGKVTYRCECGLNYYMSADYRRNLHIKGLSSSEIKCPKCFNKEIRHRFPEDKTKFKKYSIATDNNGFHMINYCDNDLLPFTIASESDLAHSNRCPKPEDIIMPAKNYNRTYYTKSIRYFTEAGGYLKIFNTGFRNFNGVNLFVIYNPYETKAIDKIKDRVIAIINYYTLHNCTSINTHFGYSRYTYYENWINLNTGDILLFGEDRARKLYADLKSTYCDTIEYEITSSMNKELIHNILKNYEGYKLNRNITTTESISLVDDMITDEIKARHIRF